MKILTLIIALTVAVVAPVVAQTAKLDLPQPVHPALVGQDILDSRNAGILCNMHGWAKGRDPACRVVEIKGDVACPQGTSLPKMLIQSSATISFWECRTPQEEKDYWQWFAKANCGETDMGFWSSDGSGFSTNSRWNETAKRCESLPDKCWIKGQEFNVGRERCDTLIAWARARNSANAKHAHAQQDKPAAVVTPTIFRLNADASALWQQTIQAQQAENARHEKEVNQLDMIRVAMLKAAPVPQDVWKYCAAGADGIVLCAKPLPSPEKKPEK